MSVGITLLSTFLRQERDDEDAADALLLELAPRSSSNASKMEIKDEGDYVTNSVNTEDESEGIDKNFFSANKGLTYETSVYSPHVQQDKRGWDLEAAAVDCPRWPHPCHCSLLMGCPSKGSYSARYHLTTEGEKRGKHTR